MITSNQNSTKAPDNSNDTYPTANAPPLQEGDIQTNASSTVLPTLDEIETMFSGSEEKQVGAYIALTYILKFAPELDEKSRATIDRINQHKNCKKIMNDSYYEDLKRSFEAVTNHESNTDFHKTCLFDKSYRLRAAAYAAPFILPELLEDIKKLSGDVQTTMFKQTNNNGKNALMHAACYQPQAVELLLKSMEPLKPEDKTAILKQTTTDRWNALMLAARNHPQAVEPLLKSMELLKLEDKTAILKQTSDDENALMLAVYYQPQAVEPLLKSMEPLKPKDKTAILKQTTNGWNALMLAARNHPQAVEPLLKSMEPLEPEDKTAILKKTTADRWNALMLAARNHPQAVEPLLKSMEPLKPEDKEAILKQTTSHGYNALSLAIAEQPSAVPHLAAHYAALKLPARERLELLSPLMYGYTGGKYLKVKSIASTIAQVQIDSELELLDKLYTGVEGSESQQHVIAAKKKIRAAWESYAQDKSRKNLENVQLAVIEMKNKVEESDARFSLDVLHILKNILLLITVVGAIYVGWKAVDNYSKSRSILFPSITESTLNQMEDLMETLDPDAPKPSGPAS